MIALRRPAAVAALLAPLLSGCVAAAIPVLAAGGLVKTQAAGARERTSAGPPRVAIPAGPPAAARLAGNDAESAPGQPAAIARDYNFPDGTQVTVTNSLASAPWVEPVAPWPLAASPEAADTAPRVTHLAGLTALPEPSAVESLRAFAPTGGFADFIAYAREQAAIPAAGAERHSALLADPTGLEPATRACSIHPSAVLIDLDPAGGALDTARPLAADPALAAELAQLRREGIEIGWVSNRTADRAGAIRKALASAGLDPEGRDQLVLLRFAEERKQTRRDDFAKAHCVLAIAGDERADFDELFAYLRDPDAVTPLDSLIGKRWFLVPPPLD